MWKSVLQDFGGQFVMTSGMIATQLSSAGSLDTMTPVSTLCLIRGCVIVNAKIYYFYNFMFKSTK